jgi:hypothetical protein
MPAKSKDPEPNSGRVESESDTRSYEQLHGAQDRRRAPNQPNAKMPHERDESARSTGNRLDESRPPSDRQIGHAHEDAEAGRVDTDRRGMPNDLPRSGHNRER